VEFLGQGIPGHRDLNEEDLIVRRYLQYLAAALLMLVPGAAPSMAADGQTTVNVALLDMPASCRSE
jgi:hypothetical protein